MKSAARSCGSKMQLTREDALEIVRHVRGRNARTNNFKHHSFGAYPCKFCGYWHTGHDGAPKQTKYKRVTHKTLMRNLEMENSN